MNSKFLTIILGQHKDSKPSPPAPQVARMLNSLNLEIPDQIYLKAESHHGRRRIRRLPPLLRDDDEHSKHNYDPKLISLGPFHHRNPHLHLGQTFKHKALQSFLSATGKDKSFYYNRIAADLDAIRGCYDPQIMCDELGHYNDEAFAEMMLLDGCFIVSIMEVLLSNSDSLMNVLYAVGMAGLSYAVRDMFLLENQIPYRVITLLMELRYDDPNQGLDLLEDFLNFAAFQGHHSQRKTAKEDGGGGEAEPPPLHLLEAIRRKLVLKPNPKSDLKVKGVGVRLGTRLYTSRSVTDLKAKGIDFKPSPSACLRDVSFTSNFVSSGNLHLPARCISEKTKVLFTNLVAYEMSPENVSDYAVLSYVNLLKSLVHCAGDVKELREKRVLISNLGSDEEVFGVLKEIGTCGMENASIFHEVKERIEEHYSSRGKTWMAELIHTYFDSPWTAIALLAAIFLLCLTFLQTYFTIYPSHL